MKRASSPRFATIALASSRYLLFIPEAARVVTGEGVTASARTKRVMNRGTDDSQSASWRT